MKIANKNNDIKIFVAGFAWGGILAAFASSVLLRKSSHIRKGAAAVFFFHFTCTFFKKIIQIKPKIFNFFCFQIAQYVSYISIDKVFDPLYPFFKSDMERYLEEEKEREKYIKEAGKIKIYDDLTLMMREDLHKSSKRQNGFDFLPERK